MINMNDSMKDDPIVSDIQMEHLKEYIDKVSILAVRLCGITGNNINMHRWQGYFNQIRGNIQCEQMILFVGNFGSGKSTLANVLLDEENLLPVAAKPCTSIVTEVRIKKTGMGHIARAFDLSTMKPGKDVDYEEMKSLIDGSNGDTGIAHKVHHVELDYDLEQAHDLENHPLSALEALNVKLVDCPGYGSPYFINDDIIGEYISRASHTFWLSDGTRYGGPKDEDRLKRIRNRTTRLIPVITKSDELNDAKREEITEDFKEHFRSVFRVWIEPCFVSAMDWINAKNLDNELQAQSGRMEKEARDKEEKKIAELKRESGIYKLMQEISKCARPVEVKRSKIKNSLCDFDMLIKEILKNAQDNEKLWYNKASNEMGWKKDSRYAKLDSINRDVGIYINEEAERAGDEIEAAVIVKLASLSAEQKGDVNAQQDIIQKALLEGVEKREERWKEIINSKYEDLIKEYEKDFIKDGLKLTLEKIPIDRERIIKVFAKKPKETAAGILGAALIAGTFLSGGTLPIAVGIGSAIGAIAVIYSGSKLAPDLYKEISDSKKDREEKLRSSLRKKVKLLGFSSLIKDMLDNYHENIYKACKTNYNEEVEPMLDKMNACKKIKDEISDLMEKINDHLGEFLDKRKGLT